MAYFAIHVKSGCERLVASHIEKVCIKRNRLDIEKVIVPLKTTINMTSKNIKKQIQPKFNAYIFISIGPANEKDYDQIDAEVYQLLKNASPHIRQILPHSLRREEYETFLESTHISEVEVIIPNTPLNTTENPPTLLNSIKTFSKNKYIQQRETFTKYIQSILNSKGKTVSIQFDDEKLSIVSNTKTMMELFTDTSSSIKDFVKNPLRTLLEIVVGYDKPIRNSC
ncbi:transcription termination/antitermination NusG family protein [Bacillaceae bacterium CLA-AA-H227]|uniref:Transcription termination/antitermination NusG family protein n=1 Tax=Robertmurraya yapensis (ex Hitch et al 2024) TaxID=3133160 RepID=A0ACC6SG52_9BACI